MGFLSPEFEHDVFISYPHADVMGTGMSALRKWEILLAEVLREDLALTLKQPPAVFFDASQRASQGLEISGGLGAQLQNAAADAAVLLILMSDYYIGSTWCRYERGWWQEARRASGRIDRDAPVVLAEDIAALRLPPVVARVMVTNDEHWPDDLKTVLTPPGGQPATLVTDLGARFYELAHADETTRPYGYFGDADGQSKLGMEVNRIVRHLAPKLKELRTRLDERRAAKAQAERIKAGGGLDIYLHAQSSQVQQFRQMGQVLRDHGHGVLSPDVAPTLDTPREIQAHQSKVISLLAESDLVCLIPSDDSWQTAIDLKQYGRRLRQSAEGIRGAKGRLPCVLFDHLGARIGTEQNRATAQRYEVGWIDVRQSDWPRQFNTWLATAGVVETAVP